MQDMFSIPFEYKKQNYTALVATKGSDAVREYRITIMNGELEQLLYGHHIFTSRSGKICAENISGDPTITELQNALIRALASIENSFVPM